MVICHFYDNACTAGLQFCRMKAHIDCYDKEHLRLQVISKATLKATLMPLLKTTELLLKSPQKHRNS
jgi:hypothetical protein